MNVFIYNADIWCEDCGREIRRRIRAEGFAPDDPDDESTYDSDNFPKGPYPKGGGEADSPQHCGSGADCLDPHVLPSGRRVGAWLENPLTADGEQYARQAEGEVADFWRHVYELTKENDRRKA